METYQLEALAGDHAIGAGILVPLAIARLARGTTCEATLAVDLRGLSGAADSTRSLRLCWEAGSAGLSSPALPERAVTEWAACAVASVAVLLYAGLRISQVTGDGDAFDYWVTDGERDYGLEVSGTVDEDLEARHQQKVRQLLRNPYGVDGYVAVVAFASRRMILSFHRFEEVR